MCCRSDTLLRVVPANRLSARNAVRRAGDGDDPRDDTAGGWMLLGCVLSGVGNEICCFIVRSFVFHQSIVIGVLDYSVVSWVKIDLKKVDYVLPKSCTFKALVNFIKKKKKCDGCQPF